MASPTFPLQVHNCTNEEIVCRWFMNNVLTTNEVRIAPRGSDVIRDAYVGMEIFTSKAFDPTTAYAQLRIEQPVNDIHFTEDAGGFGRGRLPEPAEMRDAALTRPLGPQPGIPERPQPVLRKPKRKKRPIFGGAARDGEHDTGDAGGYEDEAGAPFDAGEEGGGGPGGQIYVPGMGYMNPESIPPHVMRQLMAMRRGMPRGAVSYAPRAPPPPPLPRYTTGDGGERDDDAIGDAEDAEGENWLSWDHLRTRWKRYLWPALLLLVIALLAYLMLRRPQRARGAGRR